jgi:hypothetical protein
VNRCFDCGKKWPKPRRRCRKCGSRWVAEAKIADFGEFVAVSDDTFEHYRKELMDRMAYGCKSALKAVHRDHRAMAQPDSASIIVNRPCTSIDPLMLYSTVAWKVSCVSCDPNYIAKPGSYRALCMESAERTSRRLTWPT